MKGEKMAKRSSTFGSIMRKRLSDITNSQSQLKVSGQEEKRSPPNNLSAEDYIDQLLKENAALMKLLAERQKIIELSGVELQKLRTNYQKLQLQNWNLAQSNSQMLAELNLGREKMKAVQHELICKEALLKANNLELEEVEDKAGEPLPKAHDANRLCKANRRRPARSQSMGSSTAYQQVEEKETVETKRHCSRRQSCRFKSQQREPNGDLFEIEDAKLPVGWHEGGLAPSNSPIKKEEGDESCVEKHEARGSQRSSIGRPLRRAAEKVQSYKEAPLNTKMRRFE
ncbi:shugoshin-1 isoform X2 [Vitis vinifera]|uniref:shugoshin-1 isoform X2 n=1 Tax=Vitis vinifera TaxID=29760 RepID=UPI0008FF98A7|nr:shugoshin-1 isoform X2 [Vitis vinifera]|eukprot:XP_019076207.1 PREDICTED: shugoshin-1 isoform X2 [Vitis vinifera]